ncbi:unnamed protein product [Enterobius vermicularis]|uniref:Uncharacterized protein n=1 Tax=Enterobius vermicularis TaxID=51028 RepID=A0A0N4VBQ8_ENTVE|nr:unnamed protein product [Enterobius vermicularis]
MSVAESCASSPSMYASDSPSPAPSASQTPHHYSNGPRGDLALILVVEVKDGFVAQKQLHITFQYRNFRYHHNGSIEFANFGNLGSQQGGDQP